MDDLLARVIAILRNIAPDSYLVGGIVRDELLGRENHDIDVAVSIDALLVARRLANALGAAYYPLDVERDTGRVVMPNRDVIDIALFRGENIAQDLGARDFTINSMARPISDAKRLLDFFGGEVDLRARRIRAISPECFVGDPARLLRAVRLAAELGFAIEASTYALLVRDAPLVQQVAGERIREELLSMVGDSHAVDAFRTLTDSNLLPLVLPGAQFDSERGRLLGNLILLATTFAQRGNDAMRDELSRLLVDFHDALEADLRGDLSAGETNLHVIRLSALYHDAEAAMADFSAARFRRDELHYFRALVEYRNRFEDIHSPTDVLEVHRFFRDTGAGRGRMGLIVLAIAQNLGMADQSKILAIARALLHNYVDMHDAVIAPRPLLNGAELAKRFQLRGPNIGQMLKALAEAQVTGEVQTVVGAERYVAARLKPNRTD